MYIRFSSVCAVAFAGQLAASVALAQTPSPPPFGPSVEPGRALALTDLTNPNPLIPIDIYRNASVSHADLATFAWLEFISAVAPEQPACAGFPGGASRLRAGRKRVSGSARWFGKPISTARNCYLARSPMATNADPAADLGDAPIYVTTVMSSNPSQECSTIAGRAVRRAIQQSR